MTKRPSRHLPFLLLAGVAVLAAIPLGNAIKDDGLIHTIALVVALAIFADLYWLACGE